MWPNATRFPGEVQGRNELAMTNTQARPIWHVLHNGDWHTCYVNMMRRKRGGTYKTMFYCTPADGPQIILWGSEWSEKINLQLVRPCTEWIAQGRGENWIVDQVQDGEMTAQEAAQYARRLSIASRDEIQ